MKLVQEAFLEGLESVRALGIPAQGNDIAVIAAYRVFVGHANYAKQTDPRFDAQGPIYARTLILDAYLLGGKEITDDPASDAVR